MQITMSPYYVQPDFAGLREPDEAHRHDLDLVSVADVLRNAFVTPPHSIFKDVKVVTTGFDPRDDMEDDPEFHFNFRQASRLRGVDRDREDWVAEYHRLLVAAIADSCREMRAPWLLQSGGKDSTTLAIALAEARPDATCITYLGGREEDEVESARHVARTLGLRHEALVCDPGRAYDRYQSVVSRIPLLTADFAMLSYVDLGTTIAAAGGDGVIDGLGSDNYFGMLVNRRHRLLSWLAQGLRLPPRLTELPVVGRNFQLCYLLATLQMDPVERVFPGSRFTDAEVDEIFGCEMARKSKARLEPFRAEMASAVSEDEKRVIAFSIAGSAASFAKGQYTASALSLRAAYPFCDRKLSEWVHSQVPADQLLDEKHHVTKILVRKHIATRFDDLPYVSRKGSFRFDVRGLARQRYDQVLAYAVAMQELLPGVVKWLRRNRVRLDNKYHASKFYLLATVLPWLAHHGKGLEPPPRHAMVAAS